MNRADNVTLLLEGSSPTTDWARFGELVHMVRVPSFQILDGALATGMNDLGIGIDAIVIDRAIDEDQLLGLLSHLLIEFRGDVLAIMEDGSAYLSTLSRGDGRLLHHLGTEDIEFYLFARFGLRGSFSAPRSMRDH
jgi:hypothetical protein